MTSHARLAFAVLAFAAALAQAAPGDLDPTFGSGGEVALPFPAECTTQCTGFPTGLVTRPDGRVLAAITADLHTPQSHGIPSRHIFYFAQRLPDGSPDPSFGSGGIALPFTTPGAQIGYDVVLQADGKILGGVTFHSAPFTSASYVFRLNADGTADSTFGINGLAGLQASIERVAVQSDGRILVLTTGGPPLSLRRLLANGTPDPTFGTGGIAALGINVDDPGAGSDVLLPRTPAALLVQPDDRPIVAATSGSRITVIRLGRDGASDGTFNGADRIVLDNPSSLTARNVTANGQLAIQSSGRILVSGKSGAAEVIFALQPDGAIDPAFGLGGRAPIAPNPQPAFPAGAAGMVVQDDDRIVSMTHFTLERKTRDGWRDASFRHSMRNIFAGLAVAGAADRFYTAQGPLLLAWQAGDQYDVFSDARNFVMAQYRDFLDREGDSGGIIYWTNQIASGAMSRGQVAQALFDSPEFQGTIAPVARLYFAYFLRVPDYSGLQFWVKYYRDGNPLATISNAFAGSAEFQSRYGSLDNGQFVNLVYQNVLGRAPDPDGYSYWKSQLDGGAMTRGQVMTGFSESAEFQAVSRSEVFTAMTYMGMLRRGPDAAGFDYWVDYLDGGNSGLALIDAFLASQEYRERFLP